jgi:hypothetical protein
MAEILQLTSECKKGLAIRRLMEEALQQRRRAQIAQRFLSGEWAPPGTRSPDPSCLTP